LYKYICQDKDTPFIPDMFTNLSIFIWSEGRGGVII
jgi:hypothetical protein